MSPDYWGVGGDVDTWFQGRGLKFRSTTASDTAEAFSRIRTMFALPFKFSRARGQEGTWKRAATQPYLRERRRDLASFWRYIFRSQLSARATRTAWTAGALRGFLRN